MFVLIVGCGRVGSHVARRMMEDGHQVSVLDESPEAHALLDWALEDQEWEDLGGRFTVGTALEIEALEEAGIINADVVVCSTDGDNTNIVVAQIARDRYHVPKVIARVLDPYRSEWYRERGLHIVCPTQVAIEMLTDAVREVSATSETASDGRRAIDGGASA
jgi:trk system potassium uptake protein TrkA